MKQKLFFLVPLTLLLGIIIFFSGTGNIMHLGSSSLEIEPTEAELVETVRTLNAEYDHLNQEKIRLTNLVSVNKNILQVTQDGLPLLKQNYEKIVTETYKYQTQLDLLQGKMQTLEKKIADSTTRKTFCETLIGQLPSLKKTTESEKLTLQNAKPLSGNIAYVKADINTLEKEKKIQENKKTYAQLLIDRGALKLQEQTTSVKNRLTQITTSLSKTKTTLLSLGVKKEDIAIIEQNPENALEKALAGLGILGGTSEQQGSIAQKKAELDQKNARLKELTKILSDITSCPGEIKTLTTALSTTFQNQKTSLSKEITTAVSQLTPRDEAKRKVDEAEKTIHELPATIQNDERKLKQIMESDMPKVSEALSKAREQLRMLYQEKYDKLFSEKNSLEGQLATLQEQLTQFQQELGNLDQTPVQEQVITYDDNGEEVVGYRETNPNSVRATELGKTIADSETLIGNLQRQLNSVNGNINTITQAAQKSGVGLNTGGSSGGSTISGTGGTTTGGYTGGGILTSGTGGDDPVCGNGIVEAGNDITGSDDEECDDGNTQNNDGCSSSCLFEPCYKQGKLSCDLVCCLDNDICKAQYANECKAIIDEAEKDSNPCNEENETIKKIQEEYKGKQIELMRLIRRLLANMTTAQANMQIDQINYQNQHKNDENYDPNGYVETPEYKQDYSDFEANQKAYKEAQDQDLANIAEEAEKIRLLEEQCRQKQNNQNSGTDLGFAQV